MKKNLLKLDRILLTKVLFVMVLITINKTEAQVKNNGTLYIGDNAKMYIGSGSFVFGSGSVTQTSRTPLVSGKLQLSASSTFTGASASLFADGFVSTKSSSYFELPTGQGSTYAPIGITNAVVTNGVEGAYFSGSLSGTPDATISTLPTSGFWEVKGDNATLKLIWSSSVGSLTNSIANLTVAGYSVANSKWEAISSAIPTGTINSGTISTSAAVNLSDYSAFTLAEKGITCAPLIAASGNTRTWDGSSWDVQPTLADAAVLAGSYPGTAGSFVCNSLNIGANNIVLTDGQTVEVVNDITGTGTITMSSTASIMQRNDASSITPTIALTKSSRANMRANDYIYWGSPLNADAFGQLNGARAYDASNVIASALSAFDSKYKYVSGNTTATGGWQPLTATEKGKGFIMRIKDQAPFSSTADYAGHINLTFTGAANNGNVSVATANVNAVSTTSSKNNNLLANPYPSAIDADKFLEYNTDLDGVIYLWRASTPNTGAAGVAYSVADYIAYTRAGSTGYSGIGTDPFDGKIATGQGFKVKALDASATGTAFFNNCMRVSGNNTQFMRMNNNALTNTIDRFKVNITDVNGIGNQILVAYMPEASLNYDRMYDASLNTVSALQMYSILDNDTKKLAINARPVFDVEDQVALGYKKTAADAVVLTINVAQKEGVFADSNTPIYLHDTLLNLYHNFNNGAYSFTATTQEDASRFKIVYQTTLNNDTFTSVSAVAILNKGTLQISASNELQQVDVYDITGRLVMSDTPSQLSNTYLSSFNHSEGIYIVKMKMTNGAMVSQKLINKK